jgi:hypothetical protein
MTRGIGLIGLIFLLTAPAQAGVKFKIDDEKELELGWWMQAWYQHTGKERRGEGVGDFILRRNYFSLKGELAPWLGAFTHIASDRIGQDGLDQPSLGLGSGIAFRDAWIVVRLHDGLNLQLGRMYVPLTRNYGTTSTKSMLTTDLPFLQGGIRGSIFYTNKVGRDDGVTVWGNPLGGRIQYRFMVSEGVEGPTNPDDNLRFVGRVALNLMEPERAWFNQGTYLGEKRVLAFAFGADYQTELLLGQSKRGDNRIWTLDFFADQPVGRGALTAEASYSDIENSTQNNNLSDLSIGADGSTGYIQGGYLLPGQVGQGRLQPYLRYEAVSVTGGASTRFYGTGLHYYLRGHNAKVSFDYSFVDQDNPLREDQPVVTVQVAVGF